MVRKSLQSFIETLARVFVIGVVAAPTLYILAMAAISILHLNFGTR
jgi:hypothetical protein